MSGRSVLAAFLLFVLVSGGAAVAIRFTYAEMAPLWSATARFLLGAIGFWTIVAFKRIPMPRGRALMGSIWFGVLTVGLAFSLIGWGLVATPASRYQILMSSVPLLTLFLSSLHGVDSVSRRGILGALLAIGGIAVTAGGSATAELSLPHVLAILAGAACLAEGGVLIKRFPPNPPVLTNAIGMTAGTFILAAASRLAGESWTIPTRAQTWVAFGYLVLFVTVVAFLLYLHVLARWSASGTAYGFVLVPLVTIMVASALAGEAITLNFVFGSVLVLGGVVFGALLPSATKPDVLEACKDRAGQVLPRCQ